MGLNLSGLKTLMRMRLMSCLPKGDDYDFIFGIFYSGLALLRNYIQLCSSFSMFSIKFMKIGCYVNSSICLSCSSLSCPPKKPLLSLVERIVVGLMSASNRARSSALSLMETSLRQKMMRSFERREFATLKKIFSKMEL